MKRTTKKKNSVPRAVAPGAASKPKSSCFACCGGKGGYVIMGIILLLLAYALWVGVWNLTQVVALLLFLMAIKKFIMVAPCR